MNPKLIDVSFLRKHLSGVVSNLEHVPLAQQNENKIAYERKTNGNLKQQHLSFPMCKTIRKVTAKTTFRIILLFSLTEINRTPRSLL